MPIVIDPSPPSPAPPSQAPDIQVPKLRVPLRMGAHGLATVEQDSPEEVTACVYALIATERGSRLEQPDYGVQSASFDQFPPDEATGEWITQVGIWEPRGRVRTVAELEDLIARVTVEVAS